MDFVLRDVDGVTDAAVAVTGDALGGRPKIKFAGANLRNLSMRLKAAVSDDRQAVFALGDDVGAAKGFIDFASLFFGSLVLFGVGVGRVRIRSEEHTSELQSRLG